MILTKQKIELTIKDNNILHEQIAKPIANQPPSQYNVSSICKVFVFN